MQLTRDGVPSLFVLHPMPGGFTPPKIGDRYRIADKADKFQLMRARQMYEQKRIGTKDEVKALECRSQS